MKKGKTLDFKNRPIDFLDEELRAELGLEDGDLFSFPVDDTAIYAYKITYNEIHPYMSVKYRDKNWSEILDMILMDRKKKA